MQHLHALQRLGSAVSIDKFSSAFFDYRNDFACLRAKLERTYLLRRVPLRRELSALKRENTTIRKKTT